MECRWRVRSVGLARGGLADRRPGALSVDAADSSSRVPRLSVSFRDLHRALPGDPLAARDVLRRTVTSPRRPRPERALGTREEPATYIRTRSCFSDPPALFSLLELPFTFFRGFGPISTNQLTHPPPLPPFPLPSHPPCCF